MDAGLSEWWCGGGNGGELLDGTGWDGIGNLFSFSFPTAGGKVVSHSRMAKEGAKAPR